MTTQEDPQNPRPPYTGLKAGSIVDFLKEIDPDTDIHIEGFYFNRWKWRGDKLLALELDAVDRDFSAHHGGQLR